MMESFVSSNSNPMVFDSPQNMEGEQIISSTIQSESIRLDETLAIDPPVLSQSAEGSEMGSVPEASNSANPALPGELREPVIGMEFDSPESARVFYAGYADRTGFRVRNSKSFTSRVDDTVIMRRFVCSRQGRPTKKDPFDLSKKRRNRTSSREGCRAMLQVNRRPETSTWSVSRCVLEHCHPLGVSPRPSPSLQKKLAKKPWELMLGNAADPTHHLTNGLGPGGGVAQSLLEYFKRMQAENPAFFYAVQLDQNNCLANVFWADARARMAYSYFGDAVVLDMSCKKNKRLVPFAAFTGVNHHQQMVVFGCAFMTDESEVSFTWLFETWIALMSGRRPVSLVTSHNDDIAAAAATVFPNVRHRFCKRDIFSRCKEKLSTVYATHPSFKSELKKCVNESVSIDDFEICWRLLIGRYHLENNLWLQFLYDFRYKWVPAYFRDTFFAELQGVGKMETLHKFFQRNSITTTTLRDLVTQFDKAMTGQYEKEIQADFATVHTRPVLKTPSPLEKQASDIYTRTIFDLFQEELVESSGFLMDKIEDGMISKFRVAQVEDASKAYMVAYNASEKRISCSCCMFEFSGILCRHVFRVSLFVGILTLPEEYILRRWTRNAKSSVLSYEHCALNQNSCQKVLNWRCNDLCRDAIKFAEEGATSAVIYKVAKGALQKAFDEVFAAKRGSFLNGKR